MVSLGFLVHGKAHPERCPDPRDCCITIVSAVLLLIGVEKKTKYVAFMINGLSMTELASDIHYAFPTGLCSNSSILQCCKHREGSTIRFLNRKASQA